MPDSSFITVVARFAELASTVGLIATCIFLYRFFRGGIMGMSFAVFTTASVLLFFGVSIATLESLNYLPGYPYDALHLFLEVGFVLLLLTGLLLFYDRWTGLHRDPNYQP